MGSLTTCIKKAGAALDAEDKRAILARSKELRGSGSSAQDAATAAVREQLEKVRALLREAGDTATLAEDAALDAEAQPNGSELESSNDSNSAHPQPEKAEKPPERLTDAGEELIRNRRGKLKGLAWDDVSAMNDTLKVAQVVKANVWPRPDYAKMVEDGAPAWKVAALKSVYDKLAAAPVTRAAPTDSDLRAYIETMQTVREALAAELDRVAALPDGAELWKSIKAENVFGKVFPLPTDARTVYGRPSPFDRSSEQGKENNRRALLIGGNNAVQSLQFGYKTLGKINDLLAEGFPAKQEAWQKSWEVRATETRNDDIPEAERTGQPQQRFYVYEKGSRWRLAKGGQDGGYATQEQAEAFARSLTQKKREQLPPSRGLDLADVRRTGPDWRGGKNVTAQDIMDRFGFRGVNLGEYVKAKQAIAQAHLNHVFDAMSDLADLLGVPPKAMSLNGTLGVAIGAQGSGKALAHYVQGAHEINITRDSGAGALAHEWAHAIDNYFGEMAGLAREKSAYLSTAVADTRDLGSVRPEVIEAMRHVMRTINTRPMTEAEAKKYMADQRELNQRRLDRWVKEFKGNKGADPAALDAVAEKLKRGDIGEPQDTDVETNLAEFMRAAGLKPGNAIAANAFTIAYRLRDLADESRFLNRHIPQQPTDYAKASDAMDAKKQGDGYWSTPWEKFARAFETFAIDALHDRERESLYLTGMVDSEAWRSWAAETGKTIPYPAGEERLAMQQAFQKLVDAIETRETDHGVMMFSVTDTGPSKSGAARAAVERISRDGVRSADDLRDMLAVPGYSQWARSSIAGNLDTAAALRSELDAAFPGFDWRAPKLNEQGVVTFYSEWATVDKLRQLTEIADRFSAPLASRGELKPIAARDFGFQPYMGHQELASRPAAVLFGHLRPGAGITATTPLFTITDDPSADLRHSGIPNDAVEIHSARNTNALKAHPDYKAAKAGDAGAAVRVVTDLVSEASINEAAEKFGSGAIWAYPHAQEATGLNAIPAMLAARYARQTGGTVAAPIVQVSRAYHTGADAMERLISRPKLSGQVQDGGRYVLVDDVSTMGGTLAELANHIQQGGGQVVGVVTLANAGRAPTMPALKQQIKAIESRYGQALREDFHIDPSALTRDEAGYVLGFRDADELRNRAAKTKRERVERLRSKGVSAEGEDARLSAGWDSVDAGGSREETARYAADPDRNHLRIVDFAREQVAQRKPGFLLRAVVPSGNRPDLRAAAAVARGVAGHKIIFVRQDGERVFNGVAFGSVGHNYILLDVDSTRPVMAVVGHEILHRLRAARPDLYAKLNDRLSAVIKNESAYAKKLRDRYSELGLDQLSDDKIHEELLADIFGDEWNDPEFWRELGKDKPTGFKAVVDSVAKFLDDLVSKIIKLRPFGTEQYLSDLKAARDAVLEATREFQAGEVGEGSVLPPSDLNMSVTAPSGNNAPPAETPGRAIQRKLQDQFNRFTVVREWAQEQGVPLTPDSDVWAYEERMHGRIATRVQDFREKILEPKIKAIQKAGFTMAQVAEYLHAQHAEERNKQIESIDPTNTAGSGMTTADAKAILANAKPELAALANDFRKITEDTKAILLKAGIINNDMTDAWEATYKNYVPLKGGPDEKAATTGTGKGLSVGGKQKRALGHGQRSEFIIENILRDHERAIALAEKNTVGHSLLAFVSELANPDIATVGQPEKRKVLKNSTQYEVRDGNGRRVAIFDSLDGANQLLSQQGLFGGRLAGPLTITKVAGDPTVAFMASPMMQPNEVTVYLKGHAIRVQLNDPLLARAYTRAGVEHLNQLMAMNREINALFSKVYTGYNPEFLLTNMARDWTTGLINVTGQYGAGIATKAAANYPKAFAQMLRYSMTGKSTPDIDAYRESGGSTGAAYLSDLDRIGRDVETAYDEYRGVMETLKAKGSVAAARAAARKFVGTLMAPIEHLNAAGENAMRLAVFEAVKATPGNTVEDAASAAKNSTVNFNRRGEWGPVLGAMYLFFNPAIQGTAAMADSLVNGKHRMQALALVGSLPLLAYMLAAGQFGGGDDDDEAWEAIPSGDKDKSIVIRTGEKTRITIPIPYGYAFFYSLGNAIFDLAKGRDVGKVSLRVASNLLEHFSPIGNPLEGDKPSVRGLVELVPGAVGGEAARHAMRVAANRNSFGSEIVPDSPFDPDKPDVQRLYRSTKGTLYDKAAQAMSTATGGTKSLKGGIDVSPETLKYWTRAITGGAGAFVADSAGLAGLAVRYARDPKDENAPALMPERSELPIVRRFAKDEKIGDRRRLFWDAVSQVKEAQADLKRARKLDDEAGEMKVWEQRGELVAMGGYLESLTKMVKAQRDLVDEVMADETTTLAYKRARVKALEREEETLYSEFIREFAVEKRNAAKERAGKLQTK